MRQSIVVKSLMIIVAGVAVVGGAVFVGFRHASDVRGDTEIPSVPEAAQEAEEWRVYMLGLSADDYATYTHPVYGFSFRYPKEFALLTDTWGDEDVVDLYHPTLPLGIRVSVRPLDMQGEAQGDP